MIASVLLFTMIEAGFPDRAAFAKALAAIEPGATKAEVQALLGKRDDTWAAPDDSLKVGRQAWLYGTSGPGTFPTLGRVHFDGDKVAWVVGGYGEPPPKSIISEIELRAGLQEMNRREARSWLQPGSDSLRLVQVSNMLIGKGEAKARALIGEYARLQESMLDDQNWLFWLVRVAFTSSAKDGVFPVPAIGGIHPAPPKDLSTWPTYPVVIVDDVPICLFWGVSLGGVPEQFEWYWRDNKNLMRLRSKHIVPPDDPFLVYEKIAKWPQWPFEPVGSQTPGYAVPFDRAGGLILEELAKLVRSAYDGMPVSVNSEMNGLDFERYHAEYLALKCRWDKDRQMYVRGDGTTVKGFK